MEQIKMGFEDNLPIDKVLMYAKPNFNWFQMYFMRIAFNKGLTMEQILPYINIYEHIDFVTKAQIEQICLGIKMGLTF
jgi:hypothetical protein